MSENLLELHAVLSANPFSKIRLAQSQTESASVRCAIGIGHALVCGVRRV
jgi:hypothetical protein